MEKTIQYTVKEFDCGSWATAYSYLNLKDAEENVQELLEDYVGPVIIVVELVTGFDFNREVIDTIIY